MFKQYSSVIQGISLRNSVGWVTTVLSLELRLNTKTRIALPESVTCATPVIQQHKLQWQIHQSRMAAPCPVRTLMFDQSQHMEPFSSAAVPRFLEIFDDLV